MNNKTKKIQRIISMMLCLTLIASVIHVENFKNIFNKEIPAIENETEEESTNDKFSQLLSEQQEYDESLEEVKTKNVITSFTENDDIEITEDDAYILDEKMNDSVNVILNNENVISIAFVDHYTLKNNYISEDGLYSCYEYEAILSDDFEIADNAGTPKVVVKLHVKECSDYENTNAYILKNYNDICVNGIGTINGFQPYSSTALYASTATSKNVSSSYGDMVTSSSSGIKNKGAGLDNVYTKIGFLQFNVAGASNLADRRGANNKRSYIHVANSTIRGLEEDQNNGIFKGNSSGCTLTQNDEGSTIKKAYLIIEYADEKTITAPSADAREYEHYAYPIKFAAYNKDKNRYDYVKTYMKNRCYDDNWRCLSYIDVTDFVKDYGYTNYYCINIPFNEDGLNYSETSDYHNFDHFACWKLVVIEENKDLEYPRYLRLKLGANAIDGVGGDDSTEYYAIDSLTLQGFKTPTKASLVSGEFMYSMAGADGNGNVLQYKYGSTDWTDIYGETADESINKYRTSTHPLVDRITRYNKFKKSLDHNYTAPSDSADKYVKSGADLDIVHIAGRDEENAIVVGKNVKQLDFKFEIAEGYWLGLLLDMMAITVDIEVEYENEIENIEWDKTNNKYTVTGYSKCEYDTVSGYYDTQTVIEIPNGLKTTANDVTASISGCSNKNITVNDDYVIISWGDKKTGIKKSASSSETVTLNYCTFKNDRLDWSIVFYPSEDTTGYSLRKSTFKSWLNANGIVSNSIRYANEIEKVNKDTDSATVETLVVKPAPGKWNSTTAASYYTWCVQNTTSSTDNGATKNVSNPTAPTGYVFEGWVVSSNGNKTGQWNSSTKKFTYKYEYSGESKNAIDYTLTANYRRSKSGLQVNLKSYTSVGTGYQPVLASDWTASHYKWSSADNGGANEDNLLHDTDGSTSHTLSKSLNHTNYEQICMGYYNDWDNIPNPVPENYKLTLTYNGGWDNVDDSTYQNPIRSYASGISTDMTFDTSKGTGGWSVVLGTNADFKISGSKNCVFTHGKNDNVTSYLTANWKGDYILTLPIVERWGYNFIGWYEKNEDGTETLIDSTNAGVDIIMGKNRTFFAKWELITKDETINVKWLDNTNNYTTRPDSVYVELYRISGSDDGELCSKYITETLSTTSASWITRFSNETGFADASRGTKTSTIFDPNVYFTYSNVANNTKNTNNNIFATNDGGYLIKISGNNSNPATSNTWTVTLKNLQKYDVTKENTEYVYVVKEVDCKSLDDTTQYYTSPKASTNNYSTAMSSYYNIDSYNEGASGEQSLTAYDSIEPKDFSKTIVNRIGNSVMGVKPWKSVVVQIHYNDASDKYHFRPYSLKVQLYQNYANYKNTAKDNYLDDSGVRILYKTVNAQMIKANAFSATGNSAGFDATAGLNWYFVRFGNVPTIEDSTGIKIAYDAILTYGQSRYRYTIDDTDEYNNLGQTIKNYGSSHYYSIKHQTGIQSIIDLDYTHMKKYGQIKYIGIDIPKNQVINYWNEGWYFESDNMNDIFQSSNRYYSGLLTNDYDDATFMIDTANQLIKYNDGKVGYAYPFSAFYKSMAYNLRYYYITESNEMTAVPNYDWMPIDVPDDKKTEYLFYTETLRWTFNVDLAGSNLTSLPEEYTGSNSADDRTGEYDGSIDDDYTHTNNKLTITSNVKNQSGVHIEAEDTAYKNLQIDQEQEAFLITLKQVKKNWTGSSDSTGESYTNNSYSQNGYVYCYYDTSRNRLTRIFQPEATPLNDERYTPVGNEYNVIVPANGSTTIEYLPDGKYEITCHYDIDFSNFTYETTSGKTASIEKEADGKYYLTFSSATAHDNQDITYSATIDYWRGYVDDMNNFSWARPLRDNNFGLVSGTPSDVKDKTLYPFGNNDKKNTISYETSTIKNVPNSYSVYENYTTKKYANKCPIHGTFLVNGKCTDEGCSYSIYQYHSNGSNIVDDKLPYNVYSQYKGTETKTLK